MRVVAALLSFAIVFYRFYVLTENQNAELEAIRSLSTAVTETDVAFVEFSDAAARIAGNFAQSSAAESTVLVPTTPGLTLKERKELLKKRPVDPEIVSSLKSLEYYRSVSSAVLARLIDRYEQAPPQIAHFLVQDSPLMPSKYPFRN